MENNTILLTDYSISICDLNNIDFNQKCIVNTVNQYSYVIAESDFEFKNALTNSDVLLPDGVGIVAAVKLLTNCTINRITGTDLHDFFLNKLDSEKGRCFYLGSSDSTLMLIKDKINKKFPGIKVASYSPPFKQSFSDEENSFMINIINEFKPDVLFVGMTAPKQEKWVYQHKMKLEVTTICAIGAVFDFYAETVMRPSIFWQKIWLEWFVRFVREPKRLSKRYLYYGPVFLRMLIRMKIKQYLINLQLKKIRLSSSILK